MVQFIYSYCFCQFVYPWFTLHNFLNEGYFGSQCLWGVTRQGPLSKRIVFFFLGRHLTRGNDRFMENTNSGETTPSDHLLNFFFFSYQLGFSFSPSYFHEFLKGIRVSYGVFNQTKLKMKTVWFWGEYWTVLRLILWIYFSTSLSYRKLYMK